MAEEARKIGAEVYLVGVRRGKLQLRAVDYAQWINGWMLLDAVM